MQGAWPAPGRRWGHTGPCPPGTHTPVKKPTLQASFRGPGSSCSPTTALVQERTSISQQDFVSGKIKRHLVRMLPLLECPAALSAEGR